MKTEAKRVSDYLHKWASEQPEHTAFYYNEERITYGVYEKRAESLACYLLNQGVQRGDRIGYLLHGSPEFFYLYMAAAMIGAVVAGVGVRFPVPEIRRVLQDAEPGMIFCHQSALDRLTASVQKDTPIITVSEGTPTFGKLPFESCMKEPSRKVMAELRRREEEVEGSDPLFILYTSGTTGTPKGAILTHRSVIKSAQMQVKKFGGSGGCTPEDIFQHQVPVDHVSGAVEWGVTPIVAGCTSILACGFEARRILENTQRFRGTILAGVPAMWAMMFALPDFERFDLSSVRWCMTGASPAAQGVLERMFTISPNCANPLGLTETSGFCSYTSEGATAEELAASVGRVGDELLYKIVDKNRKCVKKGEVGQVAYKGASVIEGYYRRDEMMRSALDEEGYFFSGDLAYEDENGNLYLRGRIDEMFITGGYNVYPMEVETALLNSPAVKMAAVLPIPDPVMGSVGRAYVVPEAGNPLTKQMLRRHLSEMLAGYKIPRSYVVVDQLPLTPLGKVQKKVLADEIIHEFDSDIKGLNIK